MKIGPGDDIAILGLGVSGRAAARYALWRGATVCISDSRSVERFLAEESELLAGDENLIDIDVSVHYSITDAYQANYRVENIEQLMRELIGYCILQEVTTRSVSDEMTEERGLFEAGVKSGLERSLGNLNLGIRIHGVYCVYSHAPDVVHAVFRDVSSAMEDRYRLINQAQTDSITAVADARARATKQYSGSRADSLRSVNKALGDAFRQISLADATRTLRSIQEFRMNAQAAESTLAGLDKILLLTDNPNAADLLFLKDTGSGNKQISPNILNQLKQNLEE